MAFFLCAPEEMIFEDTGLGYRRTKDLVVISVVSKQRTKEPQIAERVEKECGVAKTDVMISIVENGDADWSFGMGEAQFIRGLF